MATGRDLRAALQLMTWEELNKPIYLEGCDCTNEWNGEIIVADDIIRLDAELGTPTVTMEVKVDPRVEELRKRGILPP